MDDKGLVVGVEHIKELVDRSIENVKKSHKNLLDEGKIILVTSDGRFGYEAKGPYNAIHVGAGRIKINFSC